MWKPEKPVDKRRKTAINPISHNRFNETGGLDGCLRGRAPCRGLSSYWRKNTSAIESVELANLLRALRKVAGHLGANPGRVEYAGMSTACGNAILVEPEMVMGAYPVPEATTDLLVGLVVHQAMANIEWSAHVWKLLEPEMAQMAPVAKVVFQKIVRTGESIYVDMRADRSVLGLYTKKARDEAIPGERKRLAAGCPSVDELILTWWAGAFGRDADPDIPVEYHLPLVELNRLYSHLKTNSESVVRVTGRCEQRAGCYLEVWPKIVSRIAGLKIIDKQLYWFSYQKGPVGETQRAPGHAQEISKKLTPDLAHDIEAHLSADAVDMTPTIRAVAGYENKTVAPMSRWDFNMASHPVIDRKMVGRLKSIFYQYAERNRLVSRGLSSGRIDHRRLFRAHVDGRCFKHIDKVPSPDWCVALVIDASGSMRGGKWQLVENTVANIHKALTGYRERLSAWAYFEINGICMISKLISGNRLFTVPPSGQTASGQAIIASASMMPADVSRKVLIHITDGESNFGCDVAYGVEYCRQQKIHLVTLGCGYKDKQAMEKQYGRTIEFIDYFEQLPQAMESLFKWTFIYGGRQSFAMNATPFERHCGGGRNPVAFI